VSDGRDGRRDKEQGMARYLISFHDGAMDHIPGDELPAVAQAAHAVMREAVAAGVWIFSAGLAPRR
jgi:hypothetical protein